MNICQMISDVLRFILLNDVVVAILAITVLVCLVLGEKVKGLLKTIVSLYVLMFVFSILAVIVPASIQLAGIGVFVLGFAILFFI